MASNVNPELKRQAEEAAASNTEWERQRIDYYRSLRYDFSVTTVDSWLNDYYDKYVEVYRPQKDPSWNQIRKDADVGFFENVFAFLSSEKKKTITVKREQSRKKLQAKVDEANRIERDRCNRFNDRLNLEVSAKLGRFLQCDAMEVSEYFRFALLKDSYLLDGTETIPNFNLLYVPEKKRLVIDYNFPLMEQISRTKEWKVGKDNEISPKDMNRADYLEMYERVLFDLSVRTVGILFESDNRNVINESVFNGSCLYSEWQNMPTVILSFLMSKSQYSYERVRKMDYVSKSEIAKLDTVSYLDDIHATKAPADLWETPPSKLVVPIQSSF